MNIFFTFLFIVVFVLLIISLFMASVCVSPPGTWRFKLYCEIFHKAECDLYRLLIANVDKFELTDRQIIDNEDYFRFEGVVNDKKYRISIWVTGYKVDTLGVFDSKSGQCILCNFQEHLSSELTAKLLEHNNL